MNTVGYSTVYLQLNFLFIFLTLFNALSDAGFPVEMNYNLSCSFYVNEVVTKL